MKTAIVIPAYRPALVERLLGSLSQCTFPPDAAIYVVENGSRSGIERVCNLNTVDGRVRYLYSKLAGKTPAVNLAIRASDADFFIFFDDDITVSANIAETYVEAAHRYGHGYFFGGPFVADAEASCPSHLVCYLPRSAKGWSFADHEIEIDRSQFDYFIGFNWAAFGSDLGKSGLFSEDLGPSPMKYPAAGAETELQQRLIKRAVRPIYLPGALVYHLVSKECYTLRWTWRRYFRDGIYDYILYRKSERTIRDLFGMLLWIIYKLTQQQLKVLISRLLCLPIERRTGIKMWQGYWAGWLYAAWTRRKGGKG